MKPVQALLTNVFKKYEQLEESWTRARRQLDEECVHDLRVASRRLSAELILLESICGDDLTRPVQRRIKKLVTRLGPLRDLQVQTDLFRLDPDPHMKKFLNHLAKEEEKERKFVRQYLTRTRNQKLRSSIDRLHRKLVSNRTSCNGVFFQTRLREALTAGRAKLEAARKSQISDDPQLMHSLRIAAKTLRYLIEAATPMLVGLHPEKELSRLRKEQSELGHKLDLHLALERYRDWKKQFEKHQESETVQAA